MNDFTFADLFCGGGLATMGLIDAGGCPVYAVEADRVIANVYEAVQGPGVKVLDDRLHAGWLPPEGTPEVDVLWASPPCTEFSVGNSKLTALTDVADLYEAAAIIASRLRPRVVIIENVWQVGRYPVAQRAVNVLKAAYPHVATFRLCATHFGTYAQRDRMFLVAHVKSSLPMGTQLPKHAPEVPGRGWVGAVRNTTWLKGKPLGQFRKKNMPEILAALRRDVDSGKVVDGQVMALEYFGTTRRLKSDKENLAALHCKSGISWVRVNAKDVEASPTGVIQPAQAAWLMGCPNWFEVFMTDIGVTKTLQHRIIGNGVNCRVARQLGIAARNTLAQAR